MRLTNSLDNCCNCYPGGLLTGPEGPVMMALRFFESDSAEEMDDPERRLADALSVSEAWHVSGEESDSPAVVCVKTAGASFNMETAVF